MNEYKWMNKQKCCPIVIFFICLYFLYLQWMVVTFTWLEMGVSTVPWQKAPYFYELIVENINYLWVFLIDNILVYKLIKCFLCEKSKRKKCLNYPVYSRFHLRSLQSLNAPRMFTRMRIKTLQSHAAFK